MTDALVIAAHPQLEHSRVTRRLIEAVQGLRAQRVVLHDLYARYPDYFVDVEAEQAALRQARAIVWLHPWHWYGMPPLMKLWLDEVFVFGWAYGPGGEALRGKALWLVTSTGGTAESYRPAGHNRHAFEAFLPPYEQTAALCGLRWRPPLVLHGAHRVDEAALRAHEAAFMQGLQALLQGAEAAGAQALPACDTPAQERPRPAAAAAGPSHPA